MMQVEEKLHRCADATEAFLKEYLTTEDTDLASLYEAMRYSVLAGGKRIRPFLVQETCRMLGGDLSVGMFYAAALECLHTYSLIHDDLPCMDNDDFRRGKPTNHKIYGEAVATLAGDALLTGAFELLSAAPATPEQNGYATAALATSAGAEGMIGGQIMDLAAEEKEIDFDTLVKLHTKKTGALFRAAVQLGAIAANVAPGEGAWDALSVYAGNLGLAFQVIDDILDAYGDPQAMGKATHSDSKDGKITFLSFYSREDAKAQVQMLTEHAVAAITEIPESETLVCLAQSLAERTR